MNTLSRILCVTLLLTLPLAALAHPGHGENGFAAGFAHPFLGADHLLAMFVVGLWGVLRGRGHGMALAPLVFVGGLALGALVGAHSAGVAQIELLVACSLPVFGLMLARPRALSSAAAYAIIAAFALAHGAAHVAELPQAPRVIAGIIAGSALLHAIGMSVAALVLRERPRLACRLGQVCAFVGGGFVVAALI